MPDLTLSKTHTGDFTVGQPGSFTFTVRTSGADVYGTTTIRDTLPTGLSLPDGPVSISGTNAGSWRCSSLSNVVTCTSTNIDAPGVPNTPLFKVGESSTFTINGIVVGPAAVPGVTNTATVSNPNESSATTSNNSASDPVKVLAPDLALSKTAAAYATPSLPGDPAATTPSPATIKVITYTLRVTNSGTGVSSGPVTVTDTLPAGLLATAIGGEGWTCAALPALSCTRSDTLPAGSSYPDITLTVQAPFTTELETTPSLRDFTNVAVVSGGNDVSTSNNRGSANVRMVYAKLAKQVRNVSTGSAFALTSTGAPGQLLEYCIDFVNFGGTALNNFNVKDHVPGNTSALLTGYNTDAGSMGRAYGMRLTRNGTVTYLTSAVDSLDRGSLSTSGGSFGAGVMDAILPTALALNETGNVCFMAAIR
ncbi:DUF11 domain-containing protein [Deinococcus malanensis]|uniref:DUF11 domain-containing protein n=1 Tax=Deinococcus malanensis TaxID=1706855 RepID=UPI0016680161|nr:DUF11 domain-containing protein [Deinococcus malanensis]